MTQNEKQTSLRNNIFNIKLLAREAIYKYTESNPEVTKTEVHASLIELIHDNLGYELKEMCKTD